MILIVPVTELTPQWKESSMSIKEVITEGLDHLGLVSAIAKDLGIVEKIDERLKTESSEVKVSMGQRALALIINGLGFSDERLYVVPDFFATKPVDRLIDVDVKAEYLNDDALGRMLDSIYEYGSSRLFSEIAFEIGQEEGLLGKSAHLDTTSLSLQGNYPEQTPDKEGLKITYGYSKDHRFDLKQVVLSLTTTGKAGFPCWMEALNGNSSDKVSFHETIKKVRRFSNEMKKAPNFTWVADCALYTASKLLVTQDLRWLTRVPESIKEARQWVCQPEESIAWKDLGNGYSISSKESNYGGLEQRWILVYSQQAYNREKKTLEKKIEKEFDLAKKALWHLGNNVFSCEKEALQSLEKFKKSYKYHQASCEIERIQQYGSRGRPKKSEQKCTVGYKITGTIEANKQAIEEHLTRKGRFILATNIMDAKALPNETILKEYKEQSQVERGFRFLKDPWFMVDSVFLKKPERIEALMVIMTLCLIVYNVGEFRLREALRDRDETLPNQVGKSIQNPTLRWIFKKLRDIAVVKILDDPDRKKYRIVISNIDDLTERIVRYFGPHAIKIYDLKPN